MNIETAIHCMKVTTDECVCEECPYYGVTGADHCEKDAARLAITALEAMDNLSWIPVAERLPKAKVDVLVCTKSGWILIAWYGPNGRRWHITPADAGITREDIVAWMPLPEQYNPELLREAEVEAGQDAAAPVLQSAT